MSAGADDHRTHSQDHSLEKPSTGSIAVPSVVVPPEVAPSPARTTSPQATAPPAARWLARGAFAAAIAAALVLVAFSLNGGVRLLVVAALGLVVVVGSAWWFLAVRGVLRWLALALVLVTPVAVGLMFIRANLLWVALLVVVLAAAAGGLGKAALAREARPTGMPEHQAPPPQRPFIVMNPRSGGGKVIRFGLQEKAEALGAEVVLLEGPGPVDVEAVVREALARGADLLGVAGGDGTQALVAGVAAEHDVPFMVISAGTRNHFALDLGLDREDPSTCLAALTEDAVELRVDLGVIGGRTFVNNASFGAYAAVVQSPSYRDDKTRTTLEILPDLLQGQTGSRLVAHADGITAQGPQAVLVSDNPYQMSDLAGLGRRARLDTGQLGMVAISVDSARQAVGLLRHTRDHGLTVLETPEVVVDADTPQIPVGIDGEAVMLPTPVTCSIRAGALRVRVPRNRPGVPPPRPALSWVRLRRLASYHRLPRHDA
jgi:diacylglycerol kinase family enzyme